MTRPAISAPTRGRRRARTATTWTFSARVVMAPSPSRGVIDRPRLFGVPQMCAVADLGRTARRRPPGPQQELTEAPKGGPVVYGRRAPKPDVTAIGIGRGSVSVS